MQLFIELFFNSPLVNNQKLNIAANIQGSKTHNNTLINSSESQTEVVHSHRYKYLNHYGRYHTHTILNNTFPSITISFLYTCSCTKIRSIQCPL